MSVGQDDVIRVVAEWDVPDGTIAQLVYHFLGVTAVTASDAAIVTAAIAHLEAAWPQVDQEISDLVLGSTLEVFKWDFTNNRFDGIGSGVLTGADGIDTDEMLPHGAAGLGKIFTEAARRQARKYIPGLTEGSQVDGTISAAALSAIALFLADLDDDLLAAGLTLEFGTFNTDPTSSLFETFSSASGTVQAEAAFAYQRRRRPGTGI